MKAKPKTPTPPADLTGAAARFWHDVTGAYDLEEHHLQILAQACHCLHRLEQAKAAIKEDGLFTTDRFGQPKEHPAVEVELKNKRLFKGHLRELGLDLAPVDDGYTRPPRLPTHGPKNKKGC